MSQSNDRLYFLIRVLAIACVVVCSYLIGAHCGKKSLLQDIDEKVDTIYVHDTITQYEPILEERVVVRKEYIPVVHQDTIWRQETLFIALDREQVIWQDSLSRVYASGINTQVDSVLHFIQERVITREIVVPKVRKTRWGIGVQVGYGVQFGQQVTTSPYIGMGVSYNLLSF
jgi:hypothetical protein